ncbi:MAG TPA: TetR/AcrR family transcriptional regulator [Syntrophomonadaceae bacterium]|nr:TetR/AcrR family transcriptional regulator [Syntrophomonadaceae bacterium]
MNIQLDSLTTKEKIIKVTMDIIAEEGFQNITIRKIAGRAQVNIAAVNYHFGSKDVVINESLKEVTDQLKNTFENLKIGAENPKDRLYLFIIEYTELLFKYPDIIKNMIYYTIQNKPLSKHMEYITFIQNEGIKILKQTIAQIQPDLDDHTLYLKVLHLLSGLSFPFLMGKYTESIIKVDLDSEEMRKMHIDMLLENVCSHQ